MTVLPSSAVVTGEYRALTIFEAVPTDCGGIEVPSNDFVPHLKKGEIAVIDPDDNEPMAGEIYAVAIPSPLAPDGLAVRFVQLWCRRDRMAERGLDGRWIMDAEDAIGWWMRFGLARPPVIRAFHSMEAAEEELSSVVLSDGPMRADGIRSRIIGRVIGVVGAAV